MGIGVLAANRAVMLEGQAIESPSTRLWSRFQTGSPFGRAVQHAEIQRLE